MAAFNGRRKTRTYESLAHINAHFDAISRHVHTLEQMGFMPVHKMRVFQGFIRELQSEISHDVCDNMHALEDRDMLEFGKVRIAWEHYLNPERPAFKDPRFKLEKPAQSAKQPEKRNAAS